MTPSIKTWIKAALFIVLYLFAIGFFVNDDSGADEGGYMECTSANDC